MSENKEKTAESAAEALAKVFTLKEKKEKPNHAP